MSSPATANDDAAPATVPVGAARKPRLQPQSFVLIGLLVVEILVFSLLGGRFLTADNLFGILRDSVELGVLALAMTTVIVTGGIDLSVGSLMSLIAVLIGSFLHRQQFAHPDQSSSLQNGIVPIAGVFIIWLVVSSLAGGLNALLITRLRIPPLIVTLGTFSLYAGLAEGFGHGRENPSRFAAAFKFIGNGYVGPLPFQVVLLIFAAALFWVLLHRSTLGRALCAIGFSPQGARHAGIAVEQKIAIAYILTGLAAGLAAVVAVARVDTAKADTGSGYELMAITAVVLGGTSIFGGRGTIAGTLMGVLAIVILRNGLLMADQPGELAGILTGILLLVSIGLTRRGGASKAVHSAARSAGAQEEIEMKNSQLAVLCAVILLAAGIISGGNFLMFKSMQSHSGGTTPRHSDIDPVPVTVAMMPKSKGNAYFVACQKGAMEAADELGVKLIWDGPTDTNPAEQSRIVDTWINRGVDVIAVAVEDKDSLSTALKRAREKGIKVLTYDADAQPDARDFFVNQATAEGIGNTLMDNAARVMGGKGEFAVITASLNASNMNEWLSYIRKRIADKYPDITLVDVRPCDDQKDKAFDEANALLNSRPNLKLIMAICSPAVPGAAEAVEQAHRTDIKVIGLGLPNENKTYIKSGVTDDIVLWNTMNLGYLTVRAAHDLKTGLLKAGDSTFQAGKLGQIQIDKDKLLLGQPTTFTKDNIDQFDF